ncbi:MAG: hypothetical protein RLZZ188_1996 [Verrucomicrobiota bacterium]|jgi:hypothetical protein
MNLTDDELIEIIEDVTDALGQILLTHRELTESLVDQHHQAEVSQRRIDDLKKRLELEKNRLVSTRRAQRRKRELERIRQRRQRSKFRRS